MTRVAVTGPVANAIRLINEAHQPERVSVRSSTRLERHQQALAKRDARVSVRSGSGGHYFLEQKDKENTVMGTKLNLGCGENRLDGYVNVDKFGEPDVRHDLETFPWPWPDNSVEEVKLIHVLEHLGQVPDVYIGIIKELYRICEADAKIYIAVPHFRHDNFYADPTHVRPITPLGLMLFSQKANRTWIDEGASNSPLGIYHGVDFELVKTSYTASQIWRNRYPNQKGNVQMLVRESNIYNNLIEQMDFELQVIKPPRDEAATAQSGE